jgi:hypothetical protein
MVRIYTYNDLRGFNTKLHNVKSNLCTFYYRDKKRYCGNYCSRRGKHGYAFHRRCWRHKVQADMKSFPPVVLLMISASERVYNRDVWINFLNRCEDVRVPLELIIYHEDMYNATIRDPQNLLSRFRPFPDVFGDVLPLRNRHGTINFAQIVLRMLEYGTKIPSASRCIVLTERTIPIRPPAVIYKTALSLNCYIDISYNTAWGPVPDGTPTGPRGKPFAAVNNYAQGLYTVEFLKAALPTVASQCKKFGIKLDRGVYSVSNKNLFEQWRTYTGTNPCEFWLLNSYLMYNRRHDKPMMMLQRFMEKTVENDKYIVTHVSEWRDDVKRAWVFKSFNKKYAIPWFDVREKKYYKGLNFPAGISLLEVLRYVRKHKKRAMFFRQVEMP